MDGSGVLWKEGGSTDDDPPISWGEICCVVCDIWDVPEARLGWTGCVRFAMLPRRRFRVDRCAIVLLVAWDWDSGVLVDGDMTSCVKGKHMSTVTEYGESVQPDRQWG